MGDHGRAAGLLDDVAADARRVGAATLLIQCLVLRAESRVPDPRLARRACGRTEAANLAEDTGHGIPLGYALAMLVLLEALSGSEVEARLHAEQGRLSARRHRLSVVEESVSFALGALQNSPPGRPEAALTHLEPTARRSPGLAVASRRSHCGRAT